jgi:uncharacterized protein
MPPTLDREAPGAGPLIQGFAGNGFRVDGQIYSHGLLLTPDGVLDWTAPALEALDIGDVEAVLAIDPAPEFLLLGTGPSMRRPSTALVAAVEARGLGVEAMDSRAAARAWGVLRAEGRWIVAALLPLG